MVRVIPHIWLNNNAEEAVNLYLTIFPESSITRIDKYTEAGKELHGFDAGTTMAVNFVLAGQPFIAINGGPAFTINPSISFTIRSGSADESRAIWAKLSEGATVLMDLDEYPFSPCFGWLNDKFGLSWQILTQTAEPPRIVPTLMFTRDKCGQAEAAITFWTSILPNSRPVEINKSPEGIVVTGAFDLAGSRFSAMDGPGPHQFGFNEAVSLFIEADTQEEIDFFWEKLSAEGSVSNCGWLKDKFGVSWQVAPAAMNRMLETGSVRQLTEVAKLVFTMQKFEIAPLQAVFEATAEKK
jgi:predicted 3-demethylubiquinone-9 3-methyltransferase (glyoxalase superfamily)